MEQSLFKTLVDQYQTPHPLLGVDGQAFPMIPYSMKLELIQNAGASQGLTMDDFINAETRRVKQILDAAYAREDSQLATRVLNELYPLMVEDIQSGNPIAVQVYSPVVNQMRYILGITQQPQPVIQEREAEPKPAFVEGDEAVYVGPEDVEPVMPINQEVEPVFQEVQPVVQATQPVSQEVEPVFQGAQPVAQEVQPAAHEIEEEPIPEPEQVGQQESVEQETNDVVQESESSTQENDHVAQEAEPAQVAAKGASAVPLKKKRTPTSAIVLFILGAAFVLAFLLINALPFIGAGTYEDLYVTGLFDIAIVCAALALVCIVVGIVIMVRSKAKR